MIINADAKHIPLPARSVNCIVTSPPYWGADRDYGYQDDGKIETDVSFSVYLGQIRSATDECYRVLVDNGTAWINLGEKWDKDGNVMNIVFHVSEMMKQSGWIVREVIIWYKENVQPSSIRSRPVISHEYIIFAAKKFPGHYYNADAVLEPANYDGRKDIQYKGSGKYGTKSHARWNQRLPDGRYARLRRSVWKISVGRNTTEHIAPFPEELPRTCILAGCPPSGVVLDPFSGSGTTGIVAEALGMHYIGLDLGLKWCKLSKPRVNQKGFSFHEKDNVDYSTDGVVGDINAIECEGRPGLLPTT
jgi:DNA modification methylase